MDTTTARARLEDMLAELDQSATVIEGEHAGDTSELSRYDQHPADSGTRLSDQDREEAVLENIEGQREQVRAALRRIDEGSYGQCVHCGRPLSPERLEARPEAARCLHCQADVEVTAGRT